MSIIYDALKKLGKKPSAPITPVNPVTPDNIPESTKPKRSKNNLNTYVLYILVIGAGFYAANTFFGLFKKLPKFSIPKSITKPAPIAPTPVVIEENIPESRPVPQLAQPDAPSIPYASPEERIQESLVLNGIFYSAEGTYALINNEIVRVGDIIEEAIVKRIDPQEVELEYEGAPLILHAGQ